MKKLLREMNIETLQKNLIKAKQLKTLSYIFIIIDLISSSSMEILKLIFNNDNTSETRQLIIFGLKVKILNKIKLDYNKLLNFLYAFPFNKI